MPFVEVKTIRGVFSTEEKSQIIEGITAVFARMKSDEFASGTWVVVNELDGSKLDLVKYFSLIDKPQDHFNKERKVAICPTVDLSRHFNLRRAQPVIRPRDTGNPCGETSDQCVYSDAPMQTGALPAAG